MAPHSALGPMLEAGEIDALISADVSQRVLNNPPYVATGFTVRSGFSPAPFRGDVSSTRRLTKDLAATAASGAHRRGVAGRRGETVHCFGQLFPLTDGHVAKDAFDRAASMSSHVVCRRIWWPHWR